MRRADWIQLTWILGSLCGSIFLLLALVVGPAAAVATYGALTIGFGPALAAFAIGQTALSVFWRRAPDWLPLRGRWLCYFACGCVVLTGYSIVLGILAWFIVTF